MNITHGKGLSDLHFGLKEKDIIQLYGKPDKIVIQESGNRDLYFNQLMIVCKLESEHDYILGWIEVHNPKTTMFDTEIFNMDLSSVLTFLKQKLNEEPEIIDYESFETYYYDKSEVELQVEFGKLKNINFGYLFDINDQPIIKNNI